MNFIHRGIQHNGGNEADQAAEQARHQWTSALLTDETRAWVHVKESDSGAVVGLIVLLTLAGLTYAYDKKRDDTPEIRIIRGALSALEQCSNNGFVITVDTARAISSACNRARSVFQDASLGAIKHAANYLQKMAVAQ